MSIDMRSCTLPHEIKEMLLRLNINMVGPALFPVLAKVERPLETLKAAKCDRHTRGYAGFRPECEVCRYFSVLVFQASLFRIQRRVNYMK